MSNSHNLPESVHTALRQLETERLDAISSCQKGYVGIGISTVIGLLLAASIHIVAGIAIAIIGAIVCGAVFIGGKKANYRNKYKNVVANAVVKSVDESLSFSPRGGISKSEFVSSQLYRSSIDRYHTEDLCAGNHGSTAVRFSEIHAQYKSESTDSNGKRRTSWHTIFRGVYFIADFNKNFQSWVTVEPDFAEKAFGFLGQKMQKLGGNLIRLESPEFEKDFVVRGSDQVEARYILTPDMQERIMELRKHFGKSIKLSFRGSRVYLAIPSKTNFFEPRIGNKATDPQTINTLRQELVKFLNIVDQLDLNTRIWTKQ